MSWRRTLMRSPSGRRRKRPSGSDWCSPQCGSSGIPTCRSPEGPPFFRFSDQAEFRRTLAHAGFTDVQVRTLTLTWRLPASDAVFDAISRGGASAPRRSCARRRRRRSSRFARPSDGVSSVTRRTVRSSSRCLAVLASGRRPGLTPDRATGRWGRIPYPHPGLGFRVGYGIRPRSDDAGGAQRRAPVRRNARGLEHGVGIGAEHRSVRVR